MPIYEYQCRKCGSIIEKMQRMSDRPLRKCRSCSGRLDKLISRTSFALKGGGWYAEGYGKKSKSTSGTSDSSSSSDSSKSSKDTATA
jgi:putative FmdB family regulatory protein